MKELILLRHAKSSWDYAVSDRNRPLTEKGMKRITNMASASASLFKKQEIIFSSPANRAMHTATLLIHTLGIAFEKLKIKEELYTFDASNLLQFIHSLDDEFDKVICVGHNPAFSSVVSYLSDTTIGNLPTAAWAHILFEQSQWSQVNAGTCTLGLPKDILV